VRQFVAFTPPAATASQPCMPAARTEARSAAALLIAATLGLVAPRSAPGCDICAIYTTTLASEAQSGPRVGLAEQYTQYTTEQLDGREVANPFGEHLYSSNAQVFAGYQLNRWIGLQLNLPILVKSWRRVVGAGQIQESTRGGIGDLALLANVLAYETASESAMFRFGLVGGLKLPTGNPDFLREEGDDGHDGDGHDHEVATGVHGHDLSFGTGSVDGIVGGDLFWSWRRLFFSAGMQYKATTEGAFDYQFADELSWIGGPGAYLYLDHGYALSLQAALSGQTKGNDTQDGSPLDDTAVTQLFVGPGIDFAYGKSLHAEVGADLPAITHNTGLQITPDFRLRGAVVWRF
jgi:hypothetical protein